MVEPEEHAAAKLRELPGIGRRCTLRAGGLTNSSSPGRLTVAAAGPALAILGRRNWC